MSNVKGWRMIATFMTAVVATGVSNSLGSAAGYAPTHEALIELKALSWLTYAIAIGALLWFLADAALILRQLLKKSPAPAVAVADDTLALDDLELDDDPFGSSSRSVW